MDARYTRDIDLATSELDIEAAVEELKALVAKDLGDCLTFNYVGLQPIKAEDECRQGFTVTLGVFLGAKWMQVLSVDLVADGIDGGDPEVVTTSSWQRVVSKLDQVVILT